MANVPPAYGGNKLESSSYSFAITKSDTVNFEYLTRAIYVGGTGDMVVVSPDGRATTFVGLPAGTVLPVSAMRVNSTNTTATNLVGMA